MEHVEAKRKNDFLAVSVYEILVKEGELSKREFMKLFRDWL